MGRTPPSPRRPRRPRAPHAPRPELEPYDAADPEVARRALEPHYEVVRLLARGQVACTYLVRDREAGRELAARVLLWETARDETARAHLRRLTRAALGLEHPNVVRTFAMSGDDEPVPYAICEFVDGVDLATLLRQGGRIPAGNAVRIAAEVAAALEAAHATGIVHGNLRPADVLVTGGMHAKIYEFDSPPFGDLGAIGNPRYVAPELLVDPGSGPRAASDVFALGAILCEMLTGTDPFAAASPMQALRKKLDGPPPPPPAAPAPVQDLLRAMLDPEPARRPASAAVRAALDAAAPA